ncbi:Trichodiene oxygenase-like protein [Hapsidospora chrysogenum ATCC 11550]|uniref:Trichodiene oxygenase-like protein n=1 Tax=Hapsidospora chrysogenum (strain ATCC 11550 / CBS 779.69 / DSM 880 / IAM 14645 / JCM 23072 / IMI 49137) TaxID=857340 RepID=A0A086T6Y2_HAPC1|nr:Trichodiene oxygenase-like protein [Hapsidospora chrysogenum ATCC 11550]
MFQHFTENRSLSDLIEIAAAVLVSVLVLKCFYNLYLHPLSGIPGPKLAALGGYYEFWYDVVLDGQYLWEIEKMHNKYGPIVRINSREIHIRDPEYYSTIYARRLAQG